jgi:hypothetical protein
MSLRNPNSERAGQVQFNGEWGPVPSSLSRVTELPLQSLFYLCTFRSIRVEAQAPQVWSLRMEGS